MLEYYEILKNSPLFAGADEAAMAHILRCMEAHICIYGKGEIIYHYGERVSWAGIVLDGKAALVAPGKDGEESHIRIVGPSESFGCSNSCLVEQPALVMVMAKKKTKILFVNLSKLFRKEALGCAYAGLVTVNLLKQTAAENLAQSLRIHIMSQRSIRDKLKLMLSQLSTDGKSAFLSMNRQELADYLGVERSALSREMARMKKEGLIDYRKNEITILYKTA